MVRWILFFFATAVVVTAQTPPRALIGAGPRMAAPRDPLEARPVRGPRQPEPGLRLLLQACQDQHAIAARGTEPLGEYLQAVAALQNPHQVADAIGELHRYGAIAAFRVGAQPEPAWPRDSNSKPYAQRLFRLLGDPPQQAAAEAQTAINMEVSLLPPSAGAREQPLTLDALERLAPNFDWHAYWA
ncbi:MAG: hypothetical protein ACRD1Y_04290, partial [Terriglobales bacterium]